jgi:hypothetical protein
LNASKRPSKDAFPRIKPRRRSTEQPCSDRFLVYRQAGRQAGSTYLAMGSPLENFQFKLIILVAEHLCVKNSVYVLEPSEMFASRGLPYACIACG